MLEKPVRIYADTSVYGGVFDEEFETSSRVFFDDVRFGRYVLVVSDIVREEVVGAPDPVRNLFAEISELAEPVEIGGEVLALRRAYIEAGIVGRRSLADALHVAFATVSRCEVIVSWNFRHIVNWEKIPQYNEVNKAKGYQEIAIHTPQQVIRYEDEDI